MPKPILIADDDLDIRNILPRQIARLYPHHSFAFTSLPHGKDLVARVRDGKYELVITDTDMPHTDGLSAIREIRTFNSTIPIILMSSNHEIRNQAAYAGANGYLPKPYDIPQLHAVLAPYLGAEQQPI